MKRPAFQFYPGDWLRATELRACSVPARGLWIDMICLMHEGTPYGHLKVNAKVIGPSHLARMVGATVPEVDEWLAELEEAGVFSRLDDGCIFSRRMVRDEESRSARAEGGKLGGNPKLIGEYNKPGFVYAARRASDGHVKIGISQSPAKRLYKIRAQYPGDEVVLLAQAVVQDMGATEKWLHQLHSDVKSGEWFALSKERADELVHLLNHLKVNGKDSRTPALAVAVASASAAANQEATPPAEPAAPRARSVSLQTYIDRLRENDERFMPLDDPLWEHANALQMPNEWLEMAFMVFRDRHRAGGKKYIDWRATFRNAVRENWLKLWRAADKGLQLTDAGVLAHRAYIDSKRQAA